MRTHWKDSIYETGSRPAPDIECVGTLVLDFPGSITVRTKCLLFSPPSVWYPVEAAQTKKRMFHLPAKSIVNSGHAGTRKVRACRDWLPMMAATKLGLSLDLTPGTKQLKSRLHTVSMWQRKEGSLWWLAPSYSLLVERENQVPREFRKAAWTQRLSRKLKWVRLGNDQHWKAQQRTS